MCVRVIRTCVSRIHNTHSRVCTFEIRVRNVKIPAGVFHSDVFRMPFMCIRLQSYLPSLSCRSRSYLFFYAYCISTVYVRYRLSCLNMSLCLLRTVLCGDSAFHGCRHKRYLFIDYNLFIIYFIFIYLYISHPSKTNVSLYRRCFISVILLMFGNWCPKFPTCVAKLDL